MLFKVDEKAKILIDSKIAASKKSVRIVLKIGKGILYGVIGFAIIYLSLNIFIPSWSLVNSWGNIEKNYGLINLVVYILALPNAIWYIFAKALAANLASAHNMERIDEELEIDEDVLRYTCRERYHSYHLDRDVIEFNIKEMDEIDYDAEMKAITFRGKILYEHKENYKKGAELGENAEVIEEFFIYDYFTPGLYSEIMKIRGEAEVKNLIDTDDEKLNDIQDTEVRKKAQKVLKIGKAVLYVGIAVAIIYIVFNFYVSGWSRYDATICIGGYIALVSVALNLAAKELASKLEGTNKRKGRNKGC